MADLHKLPKELEEKIQSIAGGVYIQIEEELSALLAAQADPQEISSEKISEHPDFQALKDEKTALQTDSEQLMLHHQNEISQLKNDVFRLNELNTRNETNLKNNAELTTARLTDSEQVLKNKLTELSFLQEEFDHLNQQALLSKEQLLQTQQTLAQLNEKLSLVELNESRLTKENQAKIATLDIQNKQISALQLQLNEANSEFELVKSEYNQSSDVLAHRQQEDQSLITEFKETINELYQQQKTAASEKQQYQDQQCQHLKDIESLQADKKQFEEKSVELVNAATAALDKENELAERLQKKEEYQIERHNKYQETKSVLAEAQKQTDALVVQLQHSEEEQLKQDEKYNDAKSALAAAEKKISQFELQLQEQQEQQQQQNLALDKQLEDAISQTSALNEKLKQADAQVQADQDNLDGLRQQRDEEQDKWAMQFTSSQNKQNELIEQVNGAEKQLAESLEQIKILEEKTEQVNQTLLTTQKRLDSSRNKYESDSDKARETIKYLRDDNFDLNARLEQEVGELENKLTEYRLRFEYAQKQLEKN